jgi:hypothetical protein
MPTFSRLKTWVSNEVLTAADLNAEFNNQLNNMTTTGIEDASVNVAAMQATADPGGVGTESLATDLLGEIRRIRFAIKRIVGGAQWYSTPDFDLTGTLGTSNIADSAITTAKIAALNVTRAKMEAIGQQLSSSSSTFQTSSATLTDVTNLSVTITTTGRPVRVLVVPDGNGSGNPMNLEMSRANDTVQGTVCIFRDSTEIYRKYNQFIATSAASVFATADTPETLDIVAAGTYTYKVQVAISPNSASQVFKFTYAKLLAYEL